MTCKYCNLPVDNLGPDTTCDGCWEVLSRLRYFSKDLIKKLLDAARPTEHWKDV